MQSRGREWGQGRCQKVPAGTARTARCDHRFCNRGEKKMDFTKEFCGLDFTKELCGLLERSQLDVEAANKRIQVWVLNVDTMAVIPKHNPDEVARRYLKFFRHLIV